MTTATVTRALQAAAGASRGRPGEERATGRPQTRLVALAGLASFDAIIIATFVAPPLWNAPGRTRERAK